MPYTATQDELNDLFAQAGKVASITLITDKYTGKSKGFAFIEMEEEQDAAKAIQELNGKDMGGRNIVVSEARPREERPSRDSHSFQRGGTGGQRRDSFRRGGNR